MNPQTQQNIVDQLIRNLNSQPPTQPASTSDNLITSVILAFSLGFAISSLLDILVVLLARG